MGRLEALPPDASPEEIDEIRLELQTWNLVQELYS